MIDLHCHTKYSDGSDSIEEVIAKAKESGLTQLAITDHNTYDGAILAHWLAPDLVMTGIELSVGYGNNEELHLLGFFPNATAFNNVRFVIKQGEIKKNLATMETIERLNEQGYEITFNELSKFSDGTINRVHICRALMKHGYISSVQEGFDKVVGDHCTAYVPREYVPIEEAAQAIHADGGIAVLAHPYNYKMTQEEIEKMLNFVVNEVDGIECFHPSATKENSEYLVKYATEHAKRITGGSDYHGENKPHISLGMMEVDDKYKIELD